MMGKTIFLTRYKVVPPSSFSPTKNGHFHYRGNKLNIHTSGGGGPGSTPDKLCSLTQAG